MLFVAAFPRPGGGQPPPPPPTASITVHVVSGTGEPLSGAKVMLEESPAKVSMSVGSRGQTAFMAKEVSSGVTNAEGSYSFTALAPGRYFLRASLDGYLSQTEGV